MPLTSGAPYPEFIHTVSEGILRHAAITVLLFTTTLVLMACGGGADGSSGDDGGVVITPLETPTGGGGQPSETPGNGAVEPTTEPLEVTLSGFVYPIVGGCLPVGDQLMPNAPRDYRDGTHEGVDFYNVDNCTPIGVGTSIVAAKGGTVIRADWDYQDLTAERYAQLAVNLTSPETLDEFRGRQVWIDHGNGVVTRYCHLNGIADGLALGDRVEAGQLIAFVGESGTPESINNPGNQYHLHFEVRVGESYLGAGLPPDEVRAIFTELFGQ